MAEHVHEAVEATEEDTPPLSSDAAGRLLASQLALYVDLKWKENHAQPFCDAVEDLSARMEEFQHLLHMTKTDSSQCLFKARPKLEEKYKEMEKVFENIDRLEAMIGRIRSDVDEMEKRLSAAEATVDEEAAGIKAYMPSFLLSKSTSSGSLLANDSAAPSSIDPMSPMNIFNTEDFFRDETN